MGAGNIAPKIGAQGVCKPVTTACASANDAIGEAFREIKFGMHDVVLAGGAEASITKIGIGGFNALRPFQQRKTQNVHLFHLTKTVMVL